MEKYKNYVMVEQIKDLIKQHRMEDALAIAEEFDVLKVKSNSDLNIIASLYLSVGMLTKARACLLELHSRYPGRNVVMQLVNLAIRLKDATEAEVFAEEFNKMAPDDYYNYIFRYSIDKMECKPLSTLIESLEKLRDTERIESWDYELAKLYHKSGDVQKCLDECRDIEVWFGEGEYVDKAKALAGYYTGNFDISFKTEAPKTPEKGVRADEVMRTEAEKPAKTDERAASEAAGVSEKETVSEAEGVLEKETVSEAEGASEEETVLEAEGASEEETVLEAEGASEEETVSEAEGVSEKEAFSEAEDVTEAMSVSETEKAVESETEDTTEPHVSDDVLYETEGITDLTASLSAVVEDVLESIRKGEDEESHTLRAVTRVRPTQAFPPVVHEETEDRKYEDIAGNIFINEGDAGKEAAVEAPAPEDKEEETVTETQKEIFIPKQQNCYEGRINPIPDGFLKEFLTDKGKDLKDYFGFLALQPEIRGQIIKTLDIMLNPQIKNISMVITGGKFSGKKDLCKGVVEILHAAGFLSADKYAVTDAMKINAMNIGDKMGRLIGSCLVVDRAGALSEKSAQSFLEMEELSSGKLTVILIDQRQETNKLFRNNRDLNSVFPNRIHIPEFDREDLEQMAYFTMSEEGYTITEEARELLIKEIDKIYRLKNEGALFTLKSFLTKIFEHLEVRGAKSFIEMTMKGVQPKRDSLIVAEDITKAVM